MSKNYEEDSKSRQMGHAQEQNIRHKLSKYSAFDTQPPYDLDQLANFYDTNFANHAAIDAKVEMWSEWAMTGR